MGTLFGYPFRTKSKSEPCSSKFCFDKLTFFDLGPTGLQSTEVQHAAQSNGFAPGARKLHAGLLDRFTGELSCDLATKRSLMTPSIGSLITETIYQRL